MNRLILVGNGFDLAHGLKTSYKDFIIWYLVKCFGNVAYLPTTYEDCLLAIEFDRLDNFSSFINRYLGRHSHLTISQEEVTLFISTSFSKQSIREVLNIQDTDLYGTITASTPPRHSANRLITMGFHVNITSDFFKGLIINCQGCNWVDIENEYFDQLIACKDKKGVFDKEKVNQLNREFTFLKEKLEAYLTLQEEQKEVKVIPELLNAIKSNFDVPDFDSIMKYHEAAKRLGLDRSNSSAIQHDLFFLNFNYTNTLSKYEEELGKNRGRFNRIEINHIHGELNQVNNPIIFGFGDEYDKQYLEFEEQRNNELFEHIKSYQYLRTPNYRNLLRFLNSDDFQVFVMGHSCGLSDRTMFKELFEHENCKSIRLFHYNGDFHDKAINVSKHFSNKGQMRKLIVDYKEADAFPQSQELK